MIDSVLNLIFRCRHKRLTRPVTLGSDTYVVCLDCGKHFSYDTDRMRIGKPLPTSLVPDVPPPPLPPAAGETHRSKFKLAAMATLLPLSVGIWSMLTSKRHRAHESSKPDFGRPGQPSK
jgi:hypothetical protein